MNDFDADLERALRPEDPADDVLSVRGMLTATFRHRNRILVMAGLAKILAAVALMFVAAVQMFAATDDRSRLLWCTGFVFAGSAVGALATVHWLLLNRHATTRELKRLELQVAALAKQLER